MVEIIAVKLVDLKYQIMQTISTYLIIASAVFYLGYRVYQTFFKKKVAGCANCPANENA